MGDTIWVIDWFYVMSSIIRLFYTKTSLIIIVFHSKQYKNAFSQ